MHKKIVVIDKRVGYLGGMNLTRSALTNGEAICKFKGPLVQDLLAAVLAYVGTAARPLVATSCH